jgi:hypothetical protein
MTDRELELQLRAWYGREIDAAEIAPASLRAAVRSIPVDRPETGPSAVRLRRPTWLLAAAVLLVTLLVVGAVAVGSRHPPTVTPLPSARLAVPPNLPSSIASLPSGTVGSWVRTASMPTFRVGATPTVVMPDGRVLFVGGDGTGDRGDPTATSAELYVPKTGSWTATGNLRTPRRTGHTATLLADGRVLVTGGSAYQGTAGGPYPQDAAEVYDPITGAWTSTGRMTTPRSQHDATLLPDGRVLVVGGYTATDFLTRTAEIYDPRTGTWVRTTSVPKRGPATLLPDGTVLVVGDTSTAQYDPDTQRWTTIATPGGPGCVPNRRGTVVLADGSVLVLCGSVFDTDALAAAVLDPAPGSWTTVAAPPRRFLLAIVLLDGRVLVADGAGGAIYGPTSQNWTAAGLPVYSGSGTPLFRVSGGDTLSYEIDTATPLLDGRVLMTIDQDAILYTPPTAP